jgi:group I intron endonuclease
MEDQKKIGIYIIISATKRFYIGQTVDFDRRYKRYKRLECKGQRHLYNSFKKYGVENHSIQIIKECFVDELNKWERFFQLFYNNAGFELMNLKITGDDDNSGHLSEEMKKNISKAHKGKILSEETRQKMSEARKGENHHLFGKTHSKETKKKMSESQTGEKHYNFGRKGKDNPKFGKGKIIQKLDISTMKVIDEGEYNYFINKGYINSGINRVCNGKSKSHHGFFWRYKPEEMQ